MGSPLFVSLERKAYLPCSALHSSSHHIDVLKLLLQSAEQALNPGQPVNEQNPLFDDAID